MAGVAAQLTLSGDAVTDVRLAACGVGPGPVRLLAAEAVVSDHGIGGEGLKLAAQAASEEVDPSGDLHATADYRRRLTGVMTSRALAQAIERARGAR